MAIRDNDTVKTFFQNDVAVLLREDLGPKSFVEVKSLLTQIRDWIVEMIDISERNSSIPVELANRIYGYVNTYNSLANEIKLYNFDVDAPSGFQKRNHIINRIQRWFGVITAGYDSGGENDFRESFSMLTVYNAMKIEDLKSIANYKQELDGMISDILGKKKEYIELVQALQKRAASQTTFDYAVIFEKQSSLYSNLHWKPTKWGGAERWLFVSVLFIAAFVAFLHYINDVLPVNFTLQSTEITVQLLTRLVVVSFFIYLVTMVIKQYTVQKHLATLNRHRQNVLNSFNLFIQAIDKDDAQTRNALMMEVAKAIYESGQTGYVSTKDGDSSSSLIEMTKYITPGKQS